MSVFGLPRVTLPERITVTTPEQALEELKKLADSGSYDFEVLHSRADDILCELLTALGHKDVVDAWEQIDKWYA
jgi:hypothetical protein